MKEESDKDENEQRKHINEESKLLKNKIPSQPNQFDKLNELSGKFFNILYIFISNSEIILHYDNTRINYPGGNNFLLFYLSFFYPFFFNW